jgi:ATP-binding cassette subfamily B protein
MITALVLPLTAWLTTRYGGRMTRNWHALYNRVGDFNARIEENVGGIRVVQAFANEDHDAGCSKRTTSATARPSSMPTGSWPYRRR